MTALSLFGIHEPPAFVHPKNRTAKKAVRILDWQTRLDAEMAMNQKAIINIDGQHWKVSQNEQGEVTFTSDYGRTETFASVDQLKTAIQSWTENPSILIVSDVQ
jgi:hypothetical protein